jgi:hypothetical protein
MNRLGLADYQIVVQARISAQLANLVIGTKRTVEQTEAVQLLNPLTILHVGFGSTWHMFDMPCINHPDFKAILLQDFIKTEPVDPCGFERNGLDPAAL